MKKESKRVEKLCGFYVSKWHLATMLLPYINSKVDKNAKIITILEENIEENIKTLVEKLNLKNGKDILQINWKNISSKKYSDIENILNKEITKTKENIILINGTKDYIEKNNENVQKYINKSEAKKIKIINLFEVTEFNHNIMEILDEHDRVLNTSGEREISEVFEGYTKKENLQNKKVADL